MIGERHANDVCVYPDPRGGEAILDLAAAIKY